MVRFAVLSDTNLDIAYPNDLQFLVIFLTENILFLIIEHVANFCITF